MRELKRNNKPTPKIVAAEFLSEDKLHDIINFTDFLHDNGLKLRWAARNAWTVKFFCNPIMSRLRINTDEKSWNVQLNFFYKYNDKITDDGLKNFVWENLYYSRAGCHQDADGNCRNQSCANVLGKKIDRVCCCGQIKIVNPTGQAVECIKALVLIAKEIVENAIAEGRIEKSNKNVSYDLIGNTPID
ncbi:MAG: hypothetical protein FWE06_00535 [Oscillospiraceae bacterium]|nr:hypothetical protein [Oscillospiraceae bacterium]